MKIVQLLPTLGYGDAVGNDTLALYQAIRELGYETGIYVERLDERVAEPGVHYYDSLPQLAEDDILLYHFSIGSPKLAKLLASLSCRKVMIYHNITPGKYFASYAPEVKREVEVGRKELKSLRDVFECCLADSAYNREDLRRAGYTCPIAVLPILVPFDDYRQAPSQEIIDRYRDGCRNILFVGRIAPNKRQEDIIRAFAVYHQREARSRLFLVGIYGEGTLYAKRLQAYVKALGLEGSVIFTGHTPFREILAYYSVADAFLCMSEHEGFCVPLLEAMHFRVPILAHASAAVPDTLGAGNGLLESREPGYVADCLEWLLENRTARAELIERQLAQLQRFQPPVVRARLASYLTCLADRGDLAAVAEQAEQKEQGEQPSFFVQVPHRTLTEEPLSFAKIPKPRLSWKGWVKNRVLKPAYGLVSTVSPRGADFVKHKIYDLCHRSQAIPASQLDAWPREDPWLLVDTTQITQVDDRSGIQRVVHNIYAELKELRPNVQAVRDNGGQLITSHKYLESQGGPHRREQQVGHVPGDKLLLLDSSWHYAGMFEPIIVDARQRGTEVSAVIYDLFPVQYPEFFASPAFVEMFVRWHDMVLAKADKVLCISRTVADAVAAYYGERHLKRRKPLRLYYFPMGADIRETGGPVRPQLASFLQRGRTFLMVGTIEPRKGHITALEAFGKLQAAGGEAQLLILGKDGWNNDGFRSGLDKVQQSGQQVLWLQDATDAELQWAYRQAEALIAASRDEGFGLPLIEAAHFGTPILASDIPIFHEVAGEHADYFTVGSPDSLCASLQAWLAADCHPDSGQIALHTWQDSARSILDILEDGTEPYKILD